MGLPALRTHQVQGGQVEAIQFMQYTTGQTFKLGEVLQSTSGSLVVSVADPATGTIIGVSLQAAGTAPGFEMANTTALLQVTGRSQKVSVSRPNDNTIYAAAFTNGSSTAVAPAQTDVGVQYGITAYSGVWTVDKAKTGGSVRVTIVGFDLDQAPDQVFFKFIASYLA